MTSSTSLATPTTFPRSDKSFFFPFPSSLPFCPFLFVVEDLFFFFFPSPASLRELTEPALHCFLSLGRAIRFSFSSLLSPFSIPPLWTQQVHLCQAFQAVSNLWISSSPPTNMFIYRAQVNDFQPPPLPLTEIVIPVRFAYRAEFPLVSTPAGHLIAFFFHEGLLLPHLIAAQYKK